MNKKIDSGKIISKKIISINKHDTAKDLYTKLNKAACNQVYQILKDLKKGNIKSKKQNIVKANFWRKRHFGDGQIEWKMNAENIYNLIKGLGDPYIGAHFIFKKKIIKVWKAKLIKSKK